MLTHEEMVKKMLAEPAVRASTMPRRRNFPCWTNSCRRDTSRPDPGGSRGEDGHQDPCRGSAGGRGGSQRHSPSIATLRRYAKAVGCRLEIRLRPPGERSADS